MRFAYSFLAGSILLLGSTFGQIQMESLILEVNKFDIQDSTLVQRYDLITRRLGDIEGIGYATMAGSAIAMVLAAICDTHHGHQQAELNKARTRRMEGER